MEEKEKSSLARFLYPENASYAGGKPPIVRFLHTENELFIIGKNRFVAQPDEVKHNIMLQVKYGEWGDSWYHVMMVIIILTGVTISLSFVFLALILLPTFSASKEVIFRIILLVAGGLGLIGALAGLYVIAYTIYNYVVYFRPMNVDGLYALFKRNRVTRVQVKELIPLDAPYVHIRYLFKDNGRYYKGRKIPPIEGRYLTTQPLNLQPGDWVYIAHIEGADIIL